MLVDARISASGKYLPVPITWLSHERTPLGPLGGNSTTGNAAASWMVAADELLHFGLKETRRKFLYNMWTKAQCAAVYITVIIKNGHPFQSIKLTLSCTSCMVSFNYTIWIFTKILYFNIVQQIFVFKQSSYLLYVARKLVHVLWCDILGRYFGLQYFGRKIL